MFVWEVGRVGLTCRPLPFCSLLAVERVINSSHRVVLSCHSNRKHGPLAMWPWQAVSMYYGSLEREREPHERSNWVLHLLRQNVRTTSPLDSLALTCLLEFTWPSYLFLEPGEIFPARTPQTGSTDRCLMMMIFCRGSCSAVSDMFVQVASPENDHYAVASSSILSSMGEIFLMLQHQSKGIYSVCIPVVPSFLSFASGSRERSLAFRSGPERGGEELGVLVAPRTSLH